MKVLFVCLSNIFRSQMGQAYYNSMTSSHDATSAGISAHDDKIPSEIVNIMKEDGLDISDQIPKRLEQKMLDGADLIVAMDPKVLETVPSAYKDKMEFWNVFDTIPSKGDEMQNIRQNIKTRVADLIKRKR